MELNRHNLYTSVFTLVDKLLDVESPGQSSRRRL